MVNANFYAALHKTSALWLALLAPNLLFMFSRFILLCTALIVLFACDKPVAYPKPRAYPRVFYPAKAYQLFDTSFCKFTFDYPVYIEINQNKNPLSTAAADACWFDLFYPQYDCRIYCTYYPIGKDKDLDRLKADAFELVDWHNKKANYIEEEPLKQAENVKGMAFSIEGPAATPFQFYLSDDKQHFFRASLYFNTKVNPDSLAPIYSFVKADMRKMIETFRWK
jgi:gliding motility-associated lipoprotein GldD